MGIDVSLEQRNKPVVKPFWRNENLWLLFILMIIGIVRLLDSISRPIEYRDESAYLVRGVQIATKGIFPPLSLSPGVSLVHAISYFFLRNSYLGMDLSGRITAFIGSMLLYLFLLLAIRKRFGNLWMLLAGLMGLLYLPLYKLDNNSSDLLYAALLSAVLYVLVRMESEWASKRLLVLFSVVMGIATLMRNDGLVAFGAFIPVLWFYTPSSSTRFFSRIGNLLLFGVLPYASIIFLFAFLNNGVSGIRDILPAARSYVAFEQGTGLQMRFELQKTGKDPWYEGSKITRKIFGSRKDNQNNVFVALLRHPSAWVQRIFWNNRDFYLRWFENHYGYLAAGTLLLFWFGLSGQFLQRRFFMGFSIIALLIPIVSYFIVTFWRPGYLAFYSPVILFCSICALQMLLGQQDDRHRFSRILILGIAVLLTAQLSYYAAKYSGYMTGVIGGIDLIEVLSAIAILGIFSIWLFNPANLSRDKKVAAVFLIIGLWLFGARGILNFSYSDKSQTVKLNATKAQAAQRDYIKYGFENLRGESICTQDPSLPWYARQKAVIVEDLASPSIKANALTVIGLMDQYGCKYLLWRGADLSGTGLVKPVFAEGDVMLFEKNVAVGK